DFLASFFFMLMIAQFTVAHVRRRVNEAHRIAPESRFLIAGWRMIRPQSTRKAQMKTILMLIVGLMLAGCGSTGNHVRNRDAVDRNRYLVEHNAVDTICACP